MEVDEVEPGKSKDVYADFCSSIEAKPYSYSYANSSECAGHLDADRQTEYLVFSAIEEEGSGQLIATMDDLTVLSQEALANVVEERTASVQINTDSEFLSEPLENYQFEEPEALTATGNWTNVDEVIEKVVQAVDTPVESFEGPQKEETDKQNSSFVTKDSQVLTESKKKNTSALPVTLPFSYAGQSFNVQSQKLILNVANFFKIHNKDAFIETIKTPQEKAAKVLNVCPTVIGKIRKSWRSGKLLEVGKKKKFVKTVLDRVSAEDEQIIRNIINGMCEANGTTPTIQMILAAAREQTNFVGSRTSFRRVLGRMGYRYAMVDKKMAMIQPSGTKFKNIDTGFSRSICLSKTEMPSLNTMESQRNSLSTTSEIQSQICGFTQNSENGIHEACVQKSLGNSSHSFTTTPVLGYSHNLPISVATPSMTKPIFQILHNGKLAMEICRHPSNPC